MVIADSMEHKAGVSRHRCRIVEGERHFSTATGMAAIGDSGASSMHSGVDMAHDGDPRSERLSDVRDVSELEPWRSDPPLVGLDSSDGVFWDGEAAVRWPYPLPDLTLADHTTRYHLLMWPPDDGHPEQPFSLAVFLCPKGVAPETHGVLAMQRAGAVHLEYRRNIGEPAFEAFPAPRVRGWSGPEFVYGGRSGDAMWTFGGHAHGLDGVDVHVTLIDNQRLRDRAHVLALLDQAMRPFR